LILTYGAKKQITKAAQIFQNSTDVHTEARNAWKN